jgi:hypothetical protein
MSEEAAFTIGIFACIILFWGEPDLMSALIQHLQQCK